ncbi:MAG: nitronate monooxygenase [Fimbriimonadaceae bacterium]|nr:nitronate monooxygenase [Chthonomonadaceae bacterium]MCO5297834.1 nitronate monooxygenase [Fimbriimonadaceae bacterium]
MGVAVSGWPLARAVSKRGQLGVVSGTGLDAVFARRLQLGDVGGFMRLGLDAFPIPEIAERVWSRYFVEGGKRPGALFKSKPVPSLHPSRALTDLTVVASFVEVFLAKHGHSGLVGINLLEKIQLPTLPALFGAMLAGVDVVLMGAGIPRAIPGALDKMAALEPTELRIDVVDALPEEVFTSKFDPREYCPDSNPLQRPKFFAIIASSTLAQTLVKRSTGRVDGFVVEGPTAGGHNAPPRGKGELSEKGEPVYGPRDVPDLEAIRELGLPFWMAGSYGSAEGLREAEEAGAQGIQVGTAFAFCEESGIDAEIKAQVVQGALDGTLHVRTDARASSTGFPFKLVELPGTLSDKRVYEQRERICDLGFLRQAYRKPDGTVGFRCSAEPGEEFVEKGGDPEAVAGRLCLCNGLLATAGFAQRRKDGSVEPPIVTAGDDVANLGRFLRPGQTSYTADDVLDSLLGG